MLPGEAAFWAAAAFEAWGRSQREQGSKDDDGETIEVVPWTALGEWQGEADLGARMSVPVLGTANDKASMLYLQQCENRRIAGGEGERIESKEGKRGRDQSLIDGIISSLCLPHFI